MRARIPTACPGPGSRARRSPAARAAARWTAITLAATALGACGSRGLPLPPVYPNPPAISGLNVAQRGSFAVLRFPPPPLQFSAGSEDVEIEEVEILVYAERYPPLTPGNLSAALGRRGELMRADAAAEAAARRALEAQQAAAEQAAAEGREPPPPDPDAPATAVAQRTPDEEALRRVPPDVRDQWRRAGLPGDAVLAAARRLAAAADELWRNLRLPNTVLDPTEPIVLPDPGTIATASAELIERATYERPLPVGPFLARAAASRRVPAEQFEELLVEDMLQVAVPVGAPSTAELRTRYFFAVRSRSTQGTPGLVTTVIPLAPVPVPVAPTEIELAVGADGVELAWTPPAGDLALRRLPPEDISYNVYRFLPDGIAPPTPLNPAPLTEPLYVDSTIQWGETYVYEVRALPADAATPLRESEGARTEPVLAEDEYPPAPPSEVLPVRAGSRVTLQWSPSPDIDIVGYRVYRHPFPAPEVPMRFDPTAAEDEPEATAPRAVGPPPGEGDPAVDNDMVATGWELITPEPVPFSRASDPDPDPAVRYVYAVEAIDAAGNLSALALGTEPGDDDR